MTATTRPARRARARTAVDAARSAAYDALRSVDTDDAYLNLALARLLAERGLSGRDAALATELAAGTARWQGSYDPVLDELVRGGAAALQPGVRTALRLGAHQLLRMRVPAHAAVTTTVELVRADVGERPVRLVNAVLRRIGERGFDEWMRRRAPAAGDDLTGHLAVRWSHPRWVVDEFRRRLDSVEEVEALLAADNAAPAVMLAVRPGLATRDALLRDQGEAAPVRAGRWSPYAVELAGGDPGALPQIRDGRAGVQDEGSQLVALALAGAAVTGRDSRWLDLCAGPGGKTALLTGLARQRGATVLACERQPHRAALVRSALRGYAAPSTVVCGDATVPAWRPGSVDRVLADVPCTGLGALRRRPESRWRHTPSDLDRLVPLQRALLSAALDAVRPGGVVVYATCSPHAAETREVVDAVRMQRRDVTEQDARALLPGMAGLGDGPHAQLWPHRHGTDAMYLSVLRRG